MPAKLAKDVIPLNREWVREHFRSIIMGDDESGKAGLTGDIKTQVIPALDFILSNHSNRTEIAEMLDFILFPKYVEPFDLKGRLEASSISESLKPVVLQLMDDMGTTETVSLLMKRVRDDRVAFHVENILTASHASHVLSETLHDMWSEGKLPKEFRQYLPIIRERKPTTPEQLLEIALNIPDLDKGYEELWGNREYKESLEGYVKAIVSPNSTPDSWESRLLYKDTINFKKSPSLAIVFDQLRSQEFWKKALEASDISEEHKSKVSGILEDIQSPEMWVSEYVYYRVKYHYAITASASGRCYYEQEEGEQKTHSQLVADHREFVVVALESIALCREELASLSKKKSASHESQQDLRSALSHTSRITLAYSSSLQYEKLFSLCDTKEPEKGKSVKFITNKTPLDYRQTLKIINENIDPPKKSSSCTSFLSRKTKLEKELKKAVKKTNPSQPSSLWKSNLTVEAITTALVKLNYSQDTIISVTEALIANQKTAKSSLAI